MPLTLRTTSPDQTRAVGEAIANLSRPGDVIVLVGDVGTGKTTLAQGFARGLGVETIVTSPTFTLVHPYDVTGAGETRTLLHADLYRLDRLRDVVDLGLDELVEDDAVALVEWGDAAPDVLGPDRLHVSLSIDLPEIVLPEIALPEPDAETFGMNEDCVRELSICWYGPSWDSRSSALAAVLEQWPSRSQRSV
ncbi:MAG TPA: tRNA (adenosine(37)-N6)-threonylcarbamoyltransferase complex ATPase subunit type 1 TsaE [Acidimicrobiales bacterium]|nr:tRNA (adenosine(37)-N6)-threonylcarbamoyltransferase complex ATPase subunit type 1 TsaE [Acidimicrobiales bacterium]